MNEKTEENIHLSVVVPAYNEEDRIGDTLIEMDRYLSGKSYGYEILIVNDGSSDKTLEVAKGYQKFLKNIRILDNKKNHGKGFVVRQGMLKAKGDYILFSDADGSTSIEHLDKVWPLIESGHDIVIGSRDPKDAKGAKQAVKQTFLKRLIGNIGNLLIQLIGVRGVWDTQNGFKLFTKESANEIFSKSKINRWGFDIEALALANKLDYKIGVIAVNWVNDDRSHVTISSYINTFWELLKIRWYLIRGVYDQQKNTLKEK